MPTNNAKGLEEVLALVIRKLERDGDEHGVGEDLHCIGEGLSALVKESNLLLKGAESVNGLTIVQPYDLANFLAALRQVEGK